MRRSRRRRRRRKPSVGRFFESHTTAGYLRFFEKNPESKNRRPDPVL
jgi:hypothetical protein